ncbi:MAG: hypothetical protein IH624_05960 [Phycisphaerae bacterium]|nr:hypothetical protein [Phycisphaerae bacterium]
MTRNRLDKQIERLLEVLDEDAAHIRSTLEHLNALRAAIIKRDEVALGDLLEAVQNEGRHRLHAELRRQRICSDIAELTGTPAETVNLSRLCDMSTDGLRSRVQARQAELKQLVQTLRMEHTCTMILMRECSRLNKMLLKGLLGRGGETVMYTARGSETWQPQNDMVNIKL